MEFMYNWDSSINVIDYLKLVYNNTSNWMNENGYSQEYAEELTNDIEDFLYYFKIKGYNVNSILDKIKDIETIEFYDSLYINTDIDTIPPVLNRGIKILLSTSISGDKRLSAKERRRLYLYQGLCHSIFSFKSNKTIAFSKFYNRYLNSNVSLTEAIVSNGWLLIEDTLSQELAEKITYRMVDKIRPCYRPGLDCEDYPISDCKITSNLEMYRMFQELLVHFGLTINKIGYTYNYSDKSILNDLIKYSISNDFSSVVIYEYATKNQSLELYQILYLMGILINEKYRTYHMNFISSELDIQDIDKIYDNIISISDSLIDFDSEDEDLSNVIVLYDEKAKRKIKSLIEKHEI